MPNTPPATADQQEIIGVGYCLKYRPDRNALWQSPDRPSPTLTTAPSSMSGYLLILHGDTNDH